jgi:hypothetical protein
MTDVSTTAWGKKRGDEKVLVTGWPQEGRVMKNVSTTPCLEQEVTNFSNHNNHVVSMRGY